MPTFLIPGIDFVLNGLHHLRLFVQAAYLDPGSGSYILQILIGAFLGAAFVVKVYWGKIKSFFGRLGSGQANQVDDQ